MDEISLNEYNKGKNNFIIILLGVILILSTITGILTTFKQETLVCNKKDDICYVEKTNLVNLKTQKRIIGISNIANVIALPNKVAGNMYAKGYTSYYLAFYTKNKTSINIFSTDYYEKSEIDPIVEQLKSDLKNKNIEIVKIERNPN